MILFPKNTAYLKNDKILIFGCSNNLVEKEMKMQMLFDTKEEAEREAYKFGCEGSRQLGDK